jgi:hypothetical protein
MQRTREWIWILAFCARFTPVILGCIWCWWVLGAFKADLAALRAGDDPLRKPRIILVWALTPAVVFVTLWLVWLYFARGWVWYDWLRL